MPKAFCRRCESVHFASPCSPESPCPGTTGKPGMEPGHCQACLDLAFVGHGAELSREINAIWDSLSSTEGLLRAAGFQPMAAKDAIWRMWNQ